MSIGRALAEYIAEQRMEPVHQYEKNIVDNGGEKPLILPGGRQHSIYPDVVNFVDQQQNVSNDSEIRREGLAYGIVSDILAPRYGGEARIASVVFDFANRLSPHIDENTGKPSEYLYEEKPDQEFRFERAFSAILNILSVLRKRDLTAYPYQNPEDPTEIKYRFTYKVSSLQVTDSARILVTAGFMRGYIIVDVGYTQE